MTSVLLVRLSAMGDLVHGLGAVAALHRVRPDWRLTFVTQAPWAALLLGMPGVHRVVVFERRPAGVLRVRRELRADSYDVALDLQGNWKSAMVGWLSGARERVGIGGSGRREPASRVLLHRTVDVPAERAHPAACAWHLVRSVAPEAPFLRPRLVPRPDELEREAAAVEAAGIDPSRPFRVVVVTDARDPRSLLRSVVDDAILASPEPVLCLVGPAEAGLADLPRSPVLRHGREPRRLMALGALVARAGGIVFGPDQGATHVLAAAGADCRVWFGAQDPALTSPPAATALVHPQPPSCAPCRRRRCNHPMGPICMDFGPDEGRRVRLPLPAEGQSS